MRNPYQHWASPAEFEYWSKGIPTKVVCRLLRRCDRTVSDWQLGRRPIPLWAIQVLQLNRLETQRAFYEMFGQYPTE
jgi:hypothetical protein